MTAFSAQAPSRKAWLMIALFGALVGINQMMVLNFAPLVTTVETRFGVSELMAGLLVLMNPVTYLVFGFNAGASIDHHGYKKVVGISAIVMTAAAFCRSLDIDYWTLLLIQTVIAATGVYITSSIAKVVSDWISPTHTGLATGVVMGLMLLGTGVGMGATPQLVGAVGWSSTLLGYALASAFITAVFLVFARERNHTVIDPKISGMAEAKALFADKNMVRVMWLSFLLIGATNGFNAWFEKIMSGNGFSPSQAGSVIGTALIFSVFGAALIPSLSDRWGKRRPFILFSCIAGALLTYPFLATSDFSLAIGLAGAAGLLQLPSYILLVALSAEFAGPAKAGLANSLVMLTNSLGGLLIALVMERVGHSFGWGNASLVLIAVYLLSAVVAVRLREPEGLAGH